MLALAADSPGYQLSLTDGHFPGGLKIIAAVPKRPVIAETITHMRSQAQLPAPAARRYTNWRPSTAT